VKQENRKKEAIKLKEGRRKCCRMKRREREREK
jgi:hypothetical protein